MFEFIEELKKEHKSIINRLLKVKHLGVHTMEGRNALMETKKLLTMHLEKEDKELYPAFRQAAERDRNLKQLLDPFEDEMKKISEFCIEFFDKYTIGGGGIEFFRDFDKLYRLLENRIQKEETILFAEYEECYALPISA